MSNRKRAFVLAIFGVLVLLAPARVRAADEEGCLFCHALELQSAAAGREGRDLRVRESTGGRHDTLFCSDCHADGRRAPHAATPGPAQCIGECHGQTAGARDSHRRASYGGLSEPHRGISSPAAPCRLCHRAADRPESRGAILERCAGCHPGERHSETRGVHARLAGPRGVGLCVACHVAHPSGSAAARTTCGGPDCHATVTAGMKRLVGHRGEVAGGRVSEAGFLAGFAALGWIVGRRLSPPGRKDGDTG
jgi:hypothetical protein